MSFSIIAAIGKNNELGKDNGLIWNLPKDLKFFKEKTTGKVVIMGRKTFESIGRVLPNRKNIIITTKDLKVDGDVEIYKNVKDVLDKYLNDNKKAFIIGGSSIYEQFLNYTDTMYLTEINVTCDDADSYFPKFDKNDWKFEILDNEEENGISYKHVKYTRK